MADTYGLLEVPLPAPTAGSAVGDPLLDVTLVFVQAVVNAKTKTAWKAVCARAVPPTTEPLPVSFVFPHQPTAESFNEKTLPALFAWRMTDLGAKSKFTQDWRVSESTIALLWVPLRATQEQARIREPFRNAVAKAIDFAFHRGRDAAWKVVGDTYFDAQTYGSTYRQQAKLMWHQLRQVDPHPIQIAFDDGPPVTYDALLAQLDVREVLEWGADAFPPIDHLEIDVDTNGITSLVTAIVKVGVTAISPNHGTVAGGDAVTITGFQFLDTPTVTIGGVACTDVTLVNETTLTATTGAHAAGAVDVVVTNPNGDTAKLAGAFTYA